MSNMGKGRLIGTAPAIRVRHLTLAAQAAGQDISRYGRGLTALAPVDYRSPNLPTFGSSAIELEIRCPRRGARAFACFDWSLFLPNRPRRGRARHQGNLAGLAEIRDLLQGRFIENSDVTTVNFDDALIAEVLYNT